MPYPQEYERNYNFQQEADAGLEAPAPGKVDTELNDIATTLAQIRAKLNAVMSADGRLRNLATALAQSLVGTNVLTGDGTVTLTTTIPWQAAFSINSVLVMVSGQILRPNQLTSVQDDGGFLEITLVTAAANAAPCVVWAFEPGNGVWAVLASAANGDGASRIAIEDAAGLYTAAHVESALAEIRLAFNTFVALVDDVATLLRSDGSVAMTDDFDGGGQKGINFAAGSASGDLVTVGQIAAYIAIWSDLEQFYVKRDGTMPFTGEQSMGNNKLVDLADADTAVDGDAVNVKTMKDYLGAQGALPIGTVMDFAGDSPPNSSWLLCDGDVYLGTDYATLYALVPSALKTGPAKGARVAKFATTILSGNLSGGGLTSLPAWDGGAGYQAVPDYEIINPDGTEANATITIGTPTSTTLTGATVTGGELPTPTIATAGSNVEVGAIIRIRAVTTGDADALVQLPTGYFRTPDLRGRGTIGAGTESKTPGITDPPDISKGDSYNATTRAFGAVGGEEQHKLTIAEIPSHRHGVTLVSGSAIGDQGSSGYSAGSSNGYVGGDEAHNVMSPFFVMTKIIKAL